MCPNPEPCVRIFITWEPDLNEVFAPGGPDGLPRAFPLTWLWDLFSLLVPFGKPYECKVLFVTAVFAVDRFSFFIADIAPFPFCDESAKLGFGYLRFIWACVLIYFFKFKSPTSFDIVLSVYEVMGPL